ncbi:UDP-glycosyltransferase UGT5-like isoform X2 [Ischnura elegans]|uniref:UDP-glycosyltransferase UGT5-like isoform X2 n=1 Tax=Ischnura elegans TaxID=197161 RepID=UPI001ED8B6AB|nr:UDP-glycosyltransferase UGT5-like isoform X2 [Ischnura elegans]
MRFVFRCYSFLLLLLLDENANADRILGLFPLSAPSHLMVFESLMRTLAERGHTVVFASPLRISEAVTPNFSNLILPMPPFNKEKFFGFLVSPQNSPLKEHLALWEYGNRICETQLSSPELQKYLSYTASDPSSEKFDLVIVEMFFVDCLMGFARHYDAPLVAMVSQYTMAWANDAVGNPKMSSHVPNWFLPFGRKMNFWDRLHNTIFNTGVTLYRRYVALAQQDEIARKYFGQDFPPLWELEKNISVVLLNGHPVLSPVHPSVPNMIDVGGMHVMANPPPLPKELQEILDKNERVILFSLGSAIDADTIDQERLAAILGTLAKLPCKVLWRWGSKATDVKLPPNVHASKWLPQQSILAHPHTVAFVTHGGLLSLQEAVYHGVPIVGFPFFGDQFLNLRHAEDAGLGFKLNFWTFRKEDLLGAIMELLSNVSYAENARKLSSVFRDQPQTPLQRGVFWVEHVLRHGGAPHLRSSAMDLSWFEYHLVDVMAVIFAGVLVGFYIFYRVCLGIVSILCASKRRKPKKE